MQFQYIQIRKKNIEMVLTKFQNLNLCGSVLWTLIGMILCRFSTYGPVENWRKGEEDEKEK